MSDDFINPFTDAQINETNDASEFFNSYAPSFDNAGFFFRISASTKWRISCAVRKFFQVHNLAIDTGFTFSSSDLAKPQGSSDSVIKYIGFSDNYTYRGFPSILIERGAFKSVPVSIGDKVKSYTGLDSKLEYGYTGSFSFPITFTILTRDKLVTETLADLLSVGLIHPLKFALMSVGIRSDGILSIGNVEKKDDPASGTNHFIYSVELLQNYSVGWRQSYTGETITISDIIFHPTSPEILS